uniref:Putative secreted protein n=1 Tax=Xenopsylla cheopis TaxID=163159 RepID=A0A6M2DVG7_XENCH
MHKIIVALCIFSLGFKSASAISCYQCNGTDAKSLFQCGEDLSAAGGSIDLVPQSCDQVHDAKFCIKHVGRYEGLLIIILLLVIAFRGRN